MQSAMAGTRSQSTTEHAFGHRSRDRVLHRDLVRRRRKPKLSTPPGCRRYTNAAKPRSFEAAVPALRP